MPESNGWLSPRPSGSSEWLSALGIDVNEDIRDARRIRFVPIRLKRVEAVEIGHITLDQDGVGAGLIRAKTNSPEPFLRSKRAGMVLDVEFGFGHGQRFW